FLPVMMVMLIWVFYVVFDEGMRKMKFSHTFLKLLVISSFLGAFTYPVWLKYKIHIRQETAGTFEEQEKRAVLQRMTQIVSDSDLPVRYTCLEETRLWGLSGAVKVDFLSLTQSDNFPLKSPVKLILVLEEEDSVPQIPLFFIEGQEELGGKKLVYGILRENTSSDLPE
ncbi:MAG: hypothetical protein KDD99_09135, partial [Bacteroidetes bacterium]|nr:hypothetical protein [Bacteroidota bacterium]